MKLFLFIETSCNVKTKQSFTATWKFSSSSLLFYFYQPVHVALVQMLLPFITVLQHFCPFIHLVISVFSIFNQKMAYGDRIHVTVEIEEMLAKAQPVFTTECCIYRVPRVIRQLNEDAYTPQLVSIGPFHHGNEKVLKMGGHKQALRHGYAEIGKVPVPGTFWVRIHLRYTWVRTY